MTYEPRFDIDMRYGEAGELYVEHVLRRGRIEVKRKTRVDDMLYVETDQLPSGKSWRKSGILTSTAEHWAFVIANTGIVVIVPTGILRGVAVHGLAQRADNLRGDNPTSGVLVTIRKLIEVGPRL